MSENYGELTYRQRDEDGNLLILRAARVKAPEMVQETSGRSPSVYEELMNMVPCRVVGPLVASFELAPDPETGVTHTLETFPGPIKRVAIKLAEARGLIGERQHYRNWDSLPEPTREAYLDEARALAAIIKEGL